MYVEKHCDSSSETLVSKIALLGSTYHGFNLLTFV